MMNKIRVELLVAILLLSFGSGMTSAVAGANPLVSPGKLKAPAVKTMPNPVQQYHYQAVARTQALKSGQVRAGGLNWQCQGSVCKISGPWPTPAVGACKALASQIGAIRSYGYSGHMLSATQLEQCNAGIVVHAGVAQPVGTLKPHLVIQSIQTNLRHPYECRTDGPTFADGDLVLKNTGSDFIPDPAKDWINVDGKVQVGSNLLSLRSAFAMRSRIPSGGTQHLRFRMTGTAGILHRATPSMSSLAGRTVPLVVTLAPRVVTGNRNSSIHFPADFCANRLSGGGVSSPIGTNNVIKPTITNLQFASGKSCVAPEGVVTIVGSGFGNAANGRNIELGGNGVGITHIPVESWSNTRIRVHLPRDAQIRYNKNYWLAVRSATDTHQSNLQLGVRLCPPAVHVGTSAGQNGGSEVVRAGLPDLEISRLTISSPSPDCFNLGTNAGVAKYYTLPTLNASITLHNIGPVTYTTHDSIHNRELPIGIIGDKYVGPPDSHNISLCMAPVAQMTFANLVIPAGGTKTIQTKLTLTNCINRGDRVVGINSRLAEPLVRGLLGTSRSVNIGVGKAVFISNEIPIESSYENNFRRFLFKFPNRTCGDR